jgi:hypothetical protein
MFLLRLLISAPKQGEIMGSIAGHAGTATAVYGQHHPPKLNSKIQTIIPHDSSSDSRLMLLVKNPDRLSAPGASNSGLKRSMMCYNQINGFSK